MIGLELRHSESNGTNDPAKFLGAECKFSNDLRRRLYELQYVAVRGDASEMRDAVGHLIDRVGSLSDIGIEIGRQAADRIVAERQISSEVKRRLRKEIEKEMRARYYKFAKELTQLYQESAATHIPPNEFRLAVAEFQNAVELNGA